MQPGVKSLNAHVVSSGVGFYSNMVATVFGDTSEIRRRSNESTFFYCHPLECFWTQIQV